MKKALLVAAILLLPLFAWAQEARPVIRFTPFESYGIGGEETRFIESIVQSYISDVGELIYSFDNLPDMALSTGGLFVDSWNKNPDYVLSGSIYLEKKIRIFTLEIKNTRTNEISSSTTSHGSSGDLALRTKSLVETVWFTRNNGTGSP